MLSRTSLRATRLTGTCVPSPLLDPDAPAGVGVGVEGAFHRGLLEDGLRAIGEVQLAYLRRTVQAS